MALQDTDILVAQRGTTAYKVPASDVKSYAAGGVPDATEAVKGKVELATAAETTAGTDTTRATHPAGVAAVLAGHVAAADPHAQYALETSLSAVATSGDYNDLANQPTLVTALGDLSDVDTSTTPPAANNLLSYDGADWVPVAASAIAPSPPDASETVKGIVELATSAETATGTDTTRAVHPAGLKAQLDLKAPLASPGLTGTPTAPTAAVGTNTTQIATTAFVLANAGGGGGLWSEIVGAGIHPTTTTYPILCANGTEGAPGISFLGKTSSGFYLIGETVGLSVSGTTAWSVDVERRLNIGGSTNLDDSLLQVNSDINISKGQIKVGQGKGSDATNVVLNTDGLSNRTTAQSCTLIGAQAGSALTSGNNNTLVGTDAGQSLTTGVLCTAVGTDALLVNSTGQSNVAIGARTLAAYLGSNSTAVGAEALRVATGSNNTAIGYRVLYNCTSGARNTGVGFNSLQSNTTGIQNCSVGNRTLFACSAGTNNTAIGTSSLESLTNGSFNVALGSSAMFDCTTGGGNVVIGHFNATGGGAPAFNITTENDRVSIGTTSTTNAYVQVAWTVVSDARDKTNFAEVPHGLAFVNQLKPCAFQFKESRDSSEANGPVRYGFKAQDILELEGDNPVIIDAENPEKYRYNGEALVPVLVNAIQELAAKVDRLQAELATLRAK